MRLWCTNPEQGRKTYPCRSGVIANKRTIRAVLLGRRVYQREGRGFSLKASIGPPSAVTIPYCHVSPPAK